MSALLTTKTFFLDEFAQRQFNNRNPDYSGLPVGASVLLWKDVFKCKPSTFTRL